MIVWLDLVFQVALYWWCRDLEARPQALIRSSSLFRHPISLPSASPCPRERSHLELSIAPSAALTLSRLHCSTLGGFVLRSSLRRPKVEPFLPGVLFDPFPCIDSESSVLKIRSFIWF